MFFWPGVENDGTLAYNISNNTYFTRAAGHQTGPEVQLDAARCGGSASQKKLNVLLVFILKVRGTYDEWMQERQDNIITGAILEYSRDCPQAFPVYI